MSRKIIAFLILSSCFCRHAFAQEPPAKSDSTKLYRDIETFSNKRKSTGFLYRIFFRPVSAAETELPKNTEIRTIQQAYRKFEGKIIREIYITTLDPFGYSVNDTNSIVQNSLYNTGNTLHIKSQRITVRNLLLFHKNQPFDSLVVKESERLIRAQKYVHEVSLLVVRAGRTDSVDIYIRELDNWSLIPEGTVSPSGANGAITDNNFLGFGHEFKNSFATDYATGINTFATNYFIPNIRNTYVSSNLHFGIDGNGNYNRSLSVDRPFFSPLAKWAAGMLFVSRFYKNYVGDVNGTLPYNLKSGMQDYWAGHANGIIKGNTEEARVTNLVVTGRYLRVRYLKNRRNNMIRCTIFSTRIFI
jgi:hypothetical protein